jgi:hypothetical protein
VLAGSIHHGEDVPGWEGHDMPITSCKEKCMENPECAGFSLLRSYHESDGTTTPNCHAHSRIISGR